MSEGKNGKIKPPGYRAGSRNQGTLMLQQLLDAEYAAINSARPGLWGHPGNS